MSPLNVLAIIGTRPEAIKMAPVIHRLHAHSAQVRLHVCTTGQHREMVDQALALFDIYPDRDLNLMAPDQTLVEVAGRALLGLGPVMRELQPDWVLVQGDTTTVMAAAIAAHYERSQVAHIEAGLRTYDRANPFPEEMNRVVVDHICDLSFAPTSRARMNLLREGIRSEQVYVTGNTSIDALQWVVGRLRARRADEGDNDPLALSDGRPLLLVTAHRRENFGRPLRQICEALRRLVQRNDVHVVYPVHPNPNVSGPVRAMLGDVPRITLLPPLDYLRFAEVLLQSALVLTDSGGIQEEAPGLGVPVLVLRDTTERPEAVESGAARLVGTEPGRIVAEAERLLRDPVAHAAMAQAPSPYGDGRAARRIVDVLLTGQCQAFVEPAALAGVTSIEAPDQLAGRVIPSVLK